MATVTIPADGLVPGDTVRVEYKILTDDPGIVGQAVYDIKRAIAADDRFDYQGSRFMTVGDLTLGRDIPLLSVWATVRRERRAPRERIEYVSLSIFETYMRSAVVAWSEFVQYIGAQIVAAVDVVREVAPQVTGPLQNFSRAAVIVAAVVAYVFFFGFPRTRRSD